MTEQGQRPEYVIARRFPPACEAAIALLCRETGQEVGEVIRTLALMGLHMRAQIEEQPAVAAECLDELLAAGRRAGRPGTATWMVPLPQGDGRERGS